MKQLHIVKVNNELQKKENKGIKKQNSLKNASLTLVHLVVVPEPRGLFVGHFRFLHRLVYHYY